MGTQGSTHSENRNTQVEVRFHEFESFVLCAGHMAGPPSVSGPAGQPPFGSFRFILILDFGGWGGFPVIVMVL